MAEPVFVRAGTLASTLKRLHAHLEAGSLQALLPQVVQSLARSVIDACAQSRRLDVLPPQGALYAFPGIDTTGLPDFDDHQFALDLLTHEGVLVVPGSSFNVPYRNHFRVTLLPEAAQIGEVFARIEHALERWERQPDTASRSAHA